ncbi:hypothetical protein [Petrotoga mobilis]|uniref:hypothetical protein n=1 Tax=Petrotoga mobilis TaxID=69499 RepID=UPI0002F254C9|nr:hypothetical protein [Petrotoga mobilis]
MVSKNKGTLISVKTLTKELGGNKIPKGIPFDKKKVYSTPHSSSGKKDNKRNCSINDSRLKEFEDKVPNV